MSRLCRAVTLPDSSAFGATWKMINREPFLQEKAKRSLLLDSVFGSLDRANGKVAIFGYSVISDRYYLAGAIEEGCGDYSNWVRQGHSAFAMEFNRRTRTRGRPRVGPVGRDRPRTAPMEDVNALKLLTFALDYAPVLLGLVEDPRQWEHSTYNLYAYGRTDRWTEHLVFPDWYMRLADTWPERQKVYRREARKHFESGLLRAILESVDRDVPLGGGDFRQRQLEARRQLRRKQRRRELGLKAFDATVAYGLAPTFGNGLAYSEAVGKYLSALLRDLVQAAAP
jgi:hypothetical protein